MNEELNLVNVKYKFFPYFRFSTWTTFSHVRPLSQIFISLAHGVSGLADRHNPGDAALSLVLANAAHED